MVDEFQQIGNMEGKTYDTVQEPEFEQRKQSLEDADCSSEEFNTCGLEPLSLKEGFDHDLPTCQSHDKVLEAANPHEILQILQSHQAGRDTFHYAYDLEKALPPLPPQLPDHQSRVVDIHELQHDQEHRVRSEEDLKRKNNSYHDKYPIQNHSSLSDRTTTTSCQSFWKVLFQGILFLYGDNRMDSDLNRGFNSTSTSYPHGLRLFLILLSGALPYVVVSCLWNLTH
jgi:hypothetical protein